MPAQQSTPKQRFYKKIDIRSNAECWNWLAYCDRDGYGQFWFNKKPILAHRFAYIIFKGEIPSGMLVCHTCDNPSCCNPKHLFLGTAKDNSSDMCKKNRQRHPIGELGSGAKLTSNDVIEIRNLVSNGYTYQNIRKIYPISDATISRIINHISWTNV